MDKILKWFMEGWCALVLGGAIAAPVAQAEAGPALPQGRQVKFETPDAVTLYADLYWQKEDHSGPMILLFHQAGASARGEYGSILPRLLDHGFSVLALDQRSGDGRFSGENRTVQGLPKDADYGYCDAYPDLEAALEYAKSVHSKGSLFAWGSSYSAGLVIRLAAEHPEGLAGILAFSPAAGGAMGKCSPEHFQKRVKVPVLALRPASEMKHEGTRKQFEAFRKLGFETHISPHGVHGSSMLVEERTGASTESTWKTVFAFLDKLSARTGTAAE